MIRKAKLILGSPSFRELEEETGRILVILPVSEGWGFWGVTQRMGICSCYHECVKCLLPLPPASAFIHMKSRWLYQEIVWTFHCCTKLPWETSVQRSNFCFNIFIPVLVSSLPSNNYLKFKLYLILDDIKSKFKFIYFLKLSKRQDWSLTNGSEFLFDKKIRLGRHKVPFFI